MLKEKYTFSRLIPSDCTGEVVERLIALHKVFYPHSSRKSLSVTDIKKSCGEHQLMVVRSKESGNPIVGFLILVPVYLCDGGIGVIETPVIDPLHEDGVLCQAFLIWTTAQAKEQGLRRVEVLHRVKGVKWQFFNSLRELNFQAVGVRLVSTTLLPQED